MDHQTSSALGRRGLGSARETTEQLGPKADSDVVSESRLELARKQAFENFISIDGQAQVLGHDLLQRGTTEAQKALPRFVSFFG